MPLAEAANCGAMSIGTAQIGATTNSTQKNAKDRHTATTIRSCPRTTGIMNRNPPKRPPAITPQRARRKFPVRLRMRSLMTPPSVSPITPDRNTPDENSAE